MGKIPVNGLFAVTFLRAYSILQTSSFSPRILPEYFLITPLYTSIKYETKS